MTVLALTAFTLAAFAANSILCRLALGEGLIDPVSFTTLRLVSGAVALIPIARLMTVSHQPGGATEGSWGSGLALFAYAAAFSLAYVSLSAGTGALILFGGVQVTMIGSAIHSGERFTLAQWCGLAGAVGGLIYLVLPGVTGPDLAGALLMGAAGISWGIYSIRGRGTPAPVQMTAGNFLKSAPVALAVMLLGLSSMHLEPAGVLLALLSGVVTSGLGYVLWYRVLKDLRTSQAAIVQLLVPVFAALGGVLFLSEELSPRLVEASGLILGGVALAVLKRVPQAAQAVPEATRL